MQALLQSLGKPCVPRWHLREMPQLSSTPGPMPACMASTNAVAHQFL